MLYRFNKRFIMFISEHKREDNSNYQSIPGKRKPDPMPIFTTARQQKEMIDNKAACDASEECPETVYHHHKQALCTCPDIRSSLCFNKQRARYIEEVESHTVNNA